MTETITSAEYKRLKTRSKYYNRTTVVDGLCFDSKKEAARWTELRRLETAGQITELKCQVRYELIPKQEGERACVYVADFVFRENGQMVCEDTKGMRTQAYIIKRKLMLWVHRIRIREI